MGNLSVNSSRLLYAFLCWNIIVFAFYGVDKWKAIHNKWRIRESTLLLLPFFMGGFGALMGMKVFRHKTKHIKFKILVPIALIVNVALIIGVFHLARGLHYG